MKILGIVAGAALLLGAQAAQAASFYSTSFENNPTLANGTQFQTFGSGTVDGWTIGGTGVDLVRDYWTAADGAQSLDLNSSGPGNISKTFTNFTAGQEYRVTFSAAANPFQGPVDKFLDVSREDSVDGANDKTTSYQLSSAIIAHNDAPGATNTIGWAAYTFYFIAGGDTTLTFASLVGANAGVALDNISIAATPIPGAILLFGSALGGMGFLGYRRKKLAVAA